MQIAIVGAGGIGGFLAANLSPTHHDVQLVARGAHLEAIRARGLRFLRPNGTETVADIPASDDFAAVASTDMVFICVKTFQLPGVVEALRGVARPGTLVVTTQNGVEAPFQVADALPDQIVVPGVVKVIALIEESGVIRHVGGAGTVVVGDLDGHLGSADKVRAALADGAVHAEVTSGVLGELWRKFLFVAPFGGLGAVTGASIGELRSAPEWRGLLRQSMLEIESLAQARAIGLNDDEVEQTMSFVDAQPHHATSSLQRDLAARRPSELDAWTGAVVRLGEQSGVPTPINAVLHQLLVPRLAQ
jgi:2-dehydropantoate 2-reductase